MVASIEIWRQRVKEIESFVDLSLDDYEGIGVGVAAACCRCAAYAV